jgi:hypothetical protein
MATFNESTRNRLAQGNMFEVDILFSAVPDLTQVYFELSASPDKALVVDHIALSSSAGQFEVLMGSSIPFTGGTPVVIKPYEQGQVNQTIGATALRDIVPDTIPVTPEDADTGLFTGLNSVSRDQPLHIQAGNAVVVSIQNTTRLGGGEVANLIMTAYMREKGR